MSDISATVLTLNEEGNIRDCLETLTWCDEIVIVDSYSDDNTVEIAREFTNQIYQYEQTGYSEPARKKAIKEASGDWTCMVDADERIPEHLAIKLRDIVEQDFHDVIYAPRQNFLLGEWMNCAGWWPDFRPILYKPSVTNLSDDIHDFISFEGSANQKYLSAEEHNSIIHFNYTGFSDFVSRMNRYTDVEAEQTEFKYRKIITAPTFEFFKRFIYKRGFKRGLTGLFLSLFMSWYRLLTIAKVWQYESKGKDEEIKQRYYEDYDD